MQENEISSGSALSELVGQNTEQKPFERFFRHELSATDSSKGSIVVSKQVDSPQVATDHFKITSKKSKPVKKAFSSINGKKMFIKNKADDKKSAKEQSRTFLAAKMLKHNDELRKAEKMALSTQLAKDTKVDHAHDTGHQTKGRKVKHEHGPDHRVKTWTKKVGHRAKTSTKKAGHVHGPNHRVKGLKKMGSSKPTDFVKRRL